MGDDKKSPSPCSINRKFLPVKVAYFTLFGGEIICLKMIQSVGGHNRPSLLKSEFSEACLGTSLSLQRSHVIPLLSNKL